jgi:hypothetical protein
VSARHLPLRLGDELGSVALELVLRSQTQEQAAWAVRQRARSTDMIVGPLAVLRAAADVGNLCMSDWGGTPRALCPADGVLKAGSLILTGTPGGTAIRAPRRLEKLGLLVRGGFTRRGAVRRYLADQLAHARELGYLAPGDIVDATAFGAQGGSGLGRQRWCVSTSQKPAGSETAAPQRENDP